MEKAARWSDRGIHEATLSDLVISPLIHLPSRLELFGKGKKLGSELDALNMYVLTLSIDRRSTALRNNSSTVEIDPSSLCPDSENLLIYKKLERKIDFAMALHLSAQEQDTLAKGTYASDDDIPSINQTSGFTRYVPMFLNVEIKRENAGVDPLVQLAVWIAAEFKKRVIEGYDRSMPVIAIAITGYTWDLYVAYEPAFESNKLENLVRFHPS